MSEAGTLVVRLKALTADFEKAFDSAGKQVKDFEKKTDDSSKGLLALGAAFAAVAGALAVAFHEASQGEDALVRLGVAARAAGIAMDPARMEAYAAGMQQLTTFSDDAFVSSASILTSFKLQQGEIEKLLPLVADLAAFQGTDLASAAGLVGRSIQSGTNALQRQGVVMSESQQKAFQAADATQRLAMMQALLANKVGGASEEMAKTASGSLKQMQNDLADLAEEIGKLLTGPIHDMVEVARPAIQALSAIISQMSPEAKVWAARLMLAGTAMLGIATAIASVQAVMGPVIAAFGTLFTTLLPIAAILMSIVGSIGLIKQIGRMGGIKVLLGMRKQTDEERAASEQIRQDSGGTFMGVIGNGIKEGFDTIMAPLKDMAKTVLPDTSGELKKLTQASRAAASNIDQAFGSNAMDFEGQSVMGQGMTLTENGDLVDTKNLEFEEAKKKVTDNLDERINKGLDDIAQSNMDTRIQVTNAEPGAEANKSMDGAGEAMEIAGNNLAGKLGKTGELVNAAAQGFQAGGPWGALIAVIVQLLASTKGFMDIIGALNDAIDDVVKAINPIMEGLKPFMRIVVTVVKRVADMLSQLAKALGPLLSIVGEMLIPIFKALDPIFQALFVVVSGVALLIAYIGKGMGSLWNGILNAIAGVFDSLGGIVIDLPGLSPFHPFGFMEDWADSVRDGRVSMDGLNDAIHDIKNGYYDDQVASIESATDATDEMTDSMAKATEELTNIPSGYKVALARFNAMDSITVAGSGSSAAVAGEDNFGTSNEMNIENVNINSRDGRDMYDQFKKFMEMEAFMKGGSPVPRGGDYGTPRSR